MEYNTQQFQPGQVLKAAQLNEMDVALKTAMQGALPVTVDLRKIKRTKETREAVQINVSGLTQGSQYFIQLYTQSRDGKAWTKMYSDSAQSELYGYQPKLAGKVRSGRADSPATYFTSDIPYWMSNNGVLISRWPIDTIINSRYDLTIIPAKWLINNLKPNEAPDFDVDNYSLIGLKRGRNGSLKFKAAVLEKLSNGAFQLVGLSDTAFLISSPNNCVSIEPDDVCITTGLSIRLR